MTTVSALFAAAAGVDPTRPLLTYYNDATGERTELSGTTLANWVAKTANLLVEGVGTGPGERALVLLPAHWQTAAVLLGCFSAGLSVLDVPEPGRPPEVAFVAAGLADPAPAAGWADPVPAAGWPEAVPDAGERFALGLHPLGLPMREVPPGYLDYVAEVRVHGDLFTPLPDDGAQDGICAVAAARARDLGIGAGDRVLLDATAYPDYRDWLLAPLAARASIVLCGQMRADRSAERAATERVSLTLSNG